MSEGPKLDHAPPPPKNTLFWLAIVGVILVLLGLIIGRVIMG
jgi:hypothetical protein